MSLDPIGDLSMALITYANGLALTKLPITSVTRFPVCAADIDGWTAREIIASLFMGDDHEFHAQIRDELILPYLFGDFHSSQLDEYAGGLLALQKLASAGHLQAGHLQDAGGGLRPILCGESWRRCFASLAAHSVRGRPGVRIPFQVGKQALGIRTPLSRF